MSNSITGNELAYKDIYEQYVDEASFLWLMHTIAVDQPHYTINDLSNIERRIEAQLSGLMTNIEMSWPTPDDHHTHPAATAASTPGSDRWAWQNF